MTKINNVKLTFVFENVLLFFVPGNSTFQSFHFMCSISLSLYLFNIPPPYSVLFLVSFTARSQGYGFLRNVRAFLKICIVCHR